MELILEKEEGISLKHKACPRCHHDFGISKNHKHKKTKHHVIPTFMKPKTVIVMNLCEDCHEELNKTYQPSKITFKYITLLQSSQHHFIFPLALFSESFFVTFPQSSQDEWLNNLVSQSFILDSPSSIHLLSLSLGMYVLIRIHLCLWSNKAYFLVFQ